MSARDEIRTRLQDQLCHELGAPVLNALARRSVTDVMLLEDDTLWTNEHGIWTRKADIIYSSETRETIIGLVAHSLHREATFMAPLVEGEVTISGRRYRFTGHLPPICLAPSIAIRKPAEVLHTLADYERDKIITGEQRIILQRAVVERQTILIAGGMGTGKSTLLNGLLAEIPHTERVATIEDTFELTLSVPNKNQLHTTSDITLQKLVRSALRLQLDRIIVGELRGAEALDWLKACNLGAPGSMTTIHANSAEAALSRLGSLVQEAGVPPQTQLITEAIDLIVFITLGKGDLGRPRRRVAEILRMEGLNVDGNFELRAVA